MNAHHSFPSCVDAALEYAARGWAVFPVPPGTKKSHKSAEHSGGRRWGATTDRDEIARDFSRWPEANVGIACGPVSGLLVIEADTADGHGVDGIGNLRALIEAHGPLPDTIEAVSPSGSWHLYFRWPEGQTIGNSASQIAPGIDVRGDGGMVVTVPSKKPGKGCYRWQNPPPLFDLADCPDWLVQLCLKPKTAKGEGFTFDTATDASRWAEAALAAEIATLAAAPKTTRNNAVNKCGFSLGQIVGGGYLDRARIEAAIWAAAVANGVAIEEPEATRRSMASGIEAGLREPRGPKDEPRAARPDRGESGDTAEDAEDTRPRIGLFAGQTAAAVEELVAVLRDDPDTFDHGGALALVASGAPHHLCEHGLAQHIGRRVAFYSVVKTKEGFAEQPADPPARLVKQTLALGARRKLKSLAAVVTAPTIAPDGRVLDRPGYDAATGLLLIGAGWPTIPSHPTADDARAALATLTEPFRAFPFAGPQDRGALLAALLTAVARPALDTAPAIAFDAPVQGSGKTLLATAVGWLAGGSVPQVWPHVAGRDDEEVRKRLFTVLRGAPPALVWDNATGIFDSAALAAFLTAPALSDRVLGRSEQLTLPNRTALILTGNNLALAGDLPRRVLKCRIDPQCETPFARSFDFDPVALVRRNRIGMAAAAVTLMRARAVSRDPLAPGDIGSFEDWARLVRQAVAWAGAVLAPGEYGDPAEGLAQAAAADPEAEGLGELLTQLHDRFGPVLFSASDVVEAASHTAGLRAALIDLAGTDRAAESTKSCGRLLRFREDRIVAGRKLIGRQIGNRRVWKVEDA